jgi:hypothetical protein
MIRREYRDEKAVKNAINRLSTGEYRVVEDSVPEMAEIVSVND